MGLKLRRFRAKLNWKSKSKDKAPEVVCLGYKISPDLHESLPPECVASYSKNNTINSNWSGAIVSPTTDAPSKPTLGINEVFKHRKSVVKPPVQQVFVTDDKIKAGNGNLTNKITNNMTFDRTKKLSLHVNTLEDKLSDQKQDIGFRRSEKLSHDSDEQRKSILIFMTEDHSEEDLPQNNFSFIENKSTPNRSILKQDTSEDKILENTHTSYNFKKPGEDQETNTITQQVQTNTICTANKAAGHHINSNNDKIQNQKSEPSESDFKVHFVENLNHSLHELESDPESPLYEKEKDEVPCRTTYYRGSTAYSSQAASIFFAGEEFETTSQGRNVKNKYQDNVSNNSQTSA